MCLLWTSLVAIHFYESEMHIPLKCHYSKEPRNCKQFMHPEAVQFCALPHPTPPPASNRHNFFGLTGFFHLSTTHKTHCMLQKSNFLPCSLDPYALSFLTIVGLKFLILFFFVYQMATKGPILQSANEKKNRHHPLLMIHLHTENYRSAFSQIYHRHRQMVPEARSSIRSEFYVFAFEGFLFFLPYCGFYVHLTLGRWVDNASIQFHNIEQIIFMYVMMMIVPIRSTVPC
jgi:hypothetical protein